ncbi:transforming growth factor-beta receptor-associated protein 1 isoform X5 [Apteryx mantelli]|uniref:Transforming growth factor-beta receptor-associated protein 1 isoform X5 n=1 Tax=Apteryx mantelli TaxID=2696672 RepID=A0ABM4EE89_9AVES|nr:PREDICTED: transforming growth factor-beta receptor-associated protein 1 isoform X1 [Apteryx mantelli mantelli]XP_013809552.1 PREDICTED: transforming growth factor-beta receptor-associated protein 1 isoform X1 [Apteryx mantelli mantelli]XP_013809553.1 PREDICTED: transforming growth factor-beta receptor-associated protein 1 isoform X1 [Apteryx mantelli mantelli]XP_013809555.1 PREDICTED: transforming growth factor-beta receptor-associated protein 1 isoform X1 [Apteryx mantelli mantelli]XP_0138
MTYSEVIKQDHPEGTMSVKAFKLVSAVEREMLMGDKAHINIECIECCGKNLYIGTNDCFIYHFLLDEKISTAGKVTFAATKQLHKYLGFKKSVTELKAASALTRLLVLCDNTITLVNMMNLEPVPTGARIKGAVTFTLNENPVSGDPFCVEVCIISVKRRTIQMFMVFEDRVQIVKEVFTPEQPYAVAVDGYYLCLALTTQYIILNYNTGISQDLFPYCSDEKRPIVKRIGRQEFLLAGPGGLGMFATVDGISQRAPVHWSENVIGAALCFPYVVALDDEFITVHSMLDQQQKQTLPFKEGHILQDFEGKVIVATNKGVYILVPLPLEKQIQDLLASHRVEEALVLAKGARRNIPKEKFQVMYKRILQQAGFIQFAQLQFLEAKELFRSGQLDVRELISLYPFLLPTSSSFIRSHPPLHEYADLNQLTQGDQEKMTKCKRFLMSYLNEVRSTDVANGYKEDIDTALLKLYAEANHESLLDLLVSENFCLLTDSAAWLEKHKKYFALGLLYHYNGQDAAALQLWVKIVNGDIQDSTRSDLYEYIVDFLTFCSDQDLVWKYSEWALQKNEEKEKYHTHLAVLYLEAIFQLKSVATDNCTETTELLFKLRSLLQKSDLYRIHFILDKIRGTDLHMESAILYGKLEEHEKALHILVHELKDFHAAEEYCIWNSENRGLQYRQRLFHMLLSVYLNTGTSDCALVMAAVDLLNNHAAEFDAALVLQLVPDNWSVQLLCPFLAGAVRQSIHTTRMTQIALGLAQAENLIYKHEKVKQKGTPILLSDKKVCQVCQNPFCKPVFVKYPNGGMVHTHCAANRHLNSNMIHRSSSSSNQT